MKVTVSEYEGCFSVTLEAETVQDAAWLVRMGMDRTKELRYATTYAGKDGRIISDITIGKSKRASSDVPRRGA